MIRFSLRTLGFVLLAAAFAALVIDGSRSIAGGRALFYSLGDSAAWLGGARFGTALGTLAGWPLPAQRIVTGLLTVPGSVASGTVGVLLLYAGRQPSPVRGVRRRGT